jgi:hypothetical protein
MAKYARVSSTKKETILDKLYARLYEKGLKLKSMVVGKITIVRRQNAQPNALVLCHSPLCKAVNKKTHFASRQIRFGNSSCNQNKSQEQLADSLQS